MSSVSLRLITLDSDPIAVDWHAPAGEPKDRFQATLSDGRHVQGRLLWLGTTNGLLLLENLEAKQTPSSSSQGLPSNPTPSTSGEGECAKPKGGMVYPFYCVEGSASCLNLWIDGQVFAIERLSQEPRRATTRAARQEGAVDGKLYAPLPGRVLRVLVAVGDSVEAGVPLLILESMKMEITLSAPSRARVAELFASTDALVDKGALLLRLESSNEQDI
jgi:hypothetical protein